MRVLLTGARAPATLELARLAARAGHVVHVADTHRWHICRASRSISEAHRLPAPRADPVAYRNAVRTLVDRLRIDVIVPTCEEVFHLAVDRGALGARVACEAISVLAPLHDKWRFVAACASAGVAAPRTHLLKTVTQLHDLPTGDYILKPRYSRFATQVTTWRSGTPTPATDPSTENAWIAQHRLDGTSLCTWSVVRRGRVDSHVTYAVDETAGLRGAAIAFHSVRHAGALEWVQRFVAHFKLSGQFAFDFIETPAGVVAIECNPRLTSGVHCFRGVPDVVNALVDPAHAARTEPLQPAADRHFRSRLALLMYGRRVRVGAGLLDAANDPWPRRLQGLAWSHLLVSSTFARKDPRRWSTQDIEWNGE